MSREALLYALLLEFIAETSLPPRPEVERRIRDAIDRGLTPRQFVDEFLDLCGDIAPGQHPKWLH